jgi:hypothetical protein
VPEPEPIEPAYQPRRPRAVALLVMTAAALTLLFPLLGGQTLLGGRNSDMFTAGYAFRLFGAEQFRATGSIPQWNPYLFGGLPYIAAMHGDVFYPTAWLRWILPVDLAITWGMAVHFVLAGFFTYLFCRALGLNWTAGVVAGIGYQLSGIVASQVSPGHDGKLFVSALAPLAFLALLRAIRQGRRWWFGWLSVIVGLCILSPHYQMTYFLLLALALWTIYLVFFDPERDPAVSRGGALGLAALAVLVGVGIAALQVLPFLQYVPYSPRATGGSNTGWDYANLFAMPPEEIVTVILPEFNGVLDKYWGRNGFKLHTEYLGVVILMLAVLGWGGRERRRLLSILGTVAVLALLFAFAGHTPFYRPFFEFMPMMKKLRALGMVFYLTALPLAIMAGIGVERLIAGQVTRQQLTLLLGGFGVFALLGLTGVLQVVAEGLAIPERMAAAQANAPDLRMGAVRLFLVVLVAGGIFWLILQRKLPGLWTAVALAAITTGDLWLVDQRFFEFGGRASTVFGPDDVTRHLLAVKPPYRVLDPVGVYPGSMLMAFRIPAVLGYHGNELRFYDELGGKARGWANITSRNFLELLAVRFVLLDRVQAIPGFRQVVGPITTAVGSTAVLYEQDTVPPYARVVAAGAKIPEAQLSATVVDPRFPSDRLVVYPESASVTVAPLSQPIPVSSIKADVTAWAPGRMTISLTGQDADESYLVVAENWYPDWRAMVDGKETAVHRADESLLSVALPPGARQVELIFRSPAYARGKLISLVSLLGAIALVMAGRMGRKTGSPPGA